MLTKNNERIQKFKETGFSRYIYQNEIGKNCFQHDMAYYITLLKLELEKRPLIKYCVIKHLTLLKI